MTASIRNEFHLALLSLLTGVGLMTVYDLVCVLRMIIPHGRLATGMEDLVYGVYSAVITFSLLYEQNDGALRAYVIAGTALGMIGSILLKYLKKGQEYLRIRMKLRKRRKKR